MIIYRMVSPPFFRGETLPRRGAHDLILAGIATEPASERESLGMPGAGMPDIVIAPDLSNLPKGAEAIDTGTGETESGDTETDTGQTPPRP
jgi:hypothetical protein